MTCSLFFFLAGEKKYDGLGAKAGSYSDQILSRSIMTFFLRSCSFLTVKLTKSVIHFSEPIQSLREVPSSKIRFSTGVV